MFCMCFNILNLQSCFTGPYSLGTPGGQPGRSVGSIGSVGSGGRMGRAGVRSGGRVKF
jgi:hypothetical protein